MARNKESQKERLYTFEEMSKILQVDTRTLMEWVQYHKIPHVRINNDYVRFRMSDIAKWVQKKNELPQKRDKFSFT
jgi:excisionase family DNA binding protein